VGRADGVPPKRLRRAEPHDPVGRALLTLGLLPALGGSIAELRRSGQDSRLIDGYLTPYAQAFERIWYFSYACEALEAYTDDPALLRAVRVLAPRRPQPRALRALLIPVVHAEALRGASVLRVFQVTGVLPALAARVRWGVPYVTTYGFSYALLSEPGPKRVVKRALERLGLRHAAAVIATTEPLRARAAVLARRVEVIPNGVDTARFAPPAVPPPRAGGPRRVLYVGRLSAEKNVGALVRAAALLGPRVPVRLVFVGEGPERAALEREARAAGVAVEFLGVLDQRALAPVYGGADAFVLASFTEGHPKVLLEAMSTGLPCAASDCEGNRSLIVPERTGLLFDSRRPEELAAALERVLTDGTLAAALGRAARAEVVARYDLSALVAREVALLLEVARGRG
jgi:glycosyltransferase involved in cell wall biosynthesis